ncbi:MAG: pantoate--beta-alanine ligase [Proteobacteria bacterium]|nr:pantoate--beta-alanine ligase [Pseudomonadota bacterium]
MIQLVDSGAVRQWCEARRAEGQRIGFVPTMGALHAGHLSLMRIAAQHADALVVSIFVNPLQFGPSEDLARYPRDLPGDGAKCAEAGVALLYCPTAEQLYPPGFQTRVEVASLARGLCGERRPGHFSGVCTVVAKLLNVVGPCVAVFGAKDYQQLQVIRRMVVDLDQPVQIVSGPIVREADGVAMSSRNAHLTAAERQQAPCLHAALQQARALVAAGERDPERVLASARAAIERAPLARLDYLELRDAQTLAPLTELLPGGTLLALAVYFGATRLIDNAVL